MKKSVVIFLICATLFSGCDANRQPVTKDIFAMDTVMTLTAYGKDANDAIDAAIEEINRLDALLSTGDSGSEISLLNENGSGTLSEDTVYLVRESIMLYKTTGGAFDITIYPLMCLWGFPTQNYHIPTEAELEKQLELTGSDWLTLDENASVLSFERGGMAIDLGGIAKGYSSARVIEIFKEYGVTSAVVSLGGNVQTLGTKPDGEPWRVGVQDPEAPSACIGVLSISDKAAVTSGGYQRYFVEDDITYHHILDPKTGKPADSGLISVTIVSDDGTLADGLSTALFVMGTDDALKYWEENKDLFDAILVTSEGRILVTAGLEDSFTSDLTYEVIQPKP